MKKSNKKTLKSLMKNAPAMSRHTKDMLFGVSNAVFSEKK